MNVDHDGEAVVGQVTGITTWNVNIGNQTVFLAYDTLDSNMFKLKKKFLIKPVASREVCLEDRLNIFEKPI